METLLEETTKLARVRDIGLPADLFAGYSERLVAAWRARAAVSYPSHLLASPTSVRLTLLAALCWSRTSEITDALVELLIRLVLKINTRAERKVEKAIFADLKRVHGKTGILFRVAEAAVEHPDETVRSAVFPVVGEKTLRELAAGRGLPELDVARVQRWCAAQVPQRLRGEIRVECDITARHLTICECRPPWRDDLGPEWTRFPIARLHHQDHRPLDAVLARPEPEVPPLPAPGPQPRVQDLLDYLDKHADPIFWG